MPKAYLHYEGTRGPAHTFVWTLPKEQVTGVDLDKALSAFAESYNRKHGEETYDGGKGMDPSLLQLTAAPADSLFGGVDGRRTPLDTTSADVVDPELVYSGCDMRVEEGKQRKVAAATAVARAPSTTAGATGGRSSGASNVSSAAVGKMVAKAEKHLASKELRAARDVLKRALKADPRNGRALRCLREVYSRAELAEEAFATAKECCAVSDSGPKDFLHAGQCLMKLGRHDEARTPLARARLAGPGAVADDADTALAQCAVELGDAQGAAGMFLQVLQRTGERHIEALVGYGRLAMTVNQLDKGMPSLLKAMVVQQDHKLARESISAALGTAEGMKALREQVVPSRETASVYAFLGSVTKDYGQIDVSVELLKVALSIDPNNASAALALVHGHEIRGEHRLALKEAEAFLSGNPERGVGKRGPKNRQVLEILGGISSSSSSSSSSSHTAGARSKLAVHWSTLVETDKGAESYVSPTPPSSSSGAGTDGNTVSFAWCEPIIAEAADAAGGAKVGVGVAKGDAQRDGEAVYKGWVGMKGGRGGRSATLKEMYASEDLDLLALYFTIVKVLYILGELSSVPPMLQLLEPTRLRSTFPLHRTSIRNEQAYYCCIAQLLSSANGNDTTPPMISPQEFPQECPAAKEGEGSGSSASSGASGDSVEEAVYVCGDSHTLTPAWRQVTVGTSRRVLKPALVTGLKHWHLRPESNFYPKKNFERELEKIPNGSAVVFMFGEIDCREGILLAVEKLRYSTVEKGMEHTASIFIKVAEAVARERRFRVFIHPVIAVLDETRSIVKAYNRVFRRMVDKSRVLKWLDFFDDLLDETGTKLLPEFRLDGTHLAPSYLRLVGRALGDVWVDRK